MSHIEIRLQLGTHLVYFVCASVKVKAKSGAGCVINVDLYGLQVRQLGKTEGAWFNIGQRFDL